MKNITYLIEIIVSATICFFSCIDDKGNYDYKEHEEVESIEIKGLEYSYSVYSLSNLVINPTIEIKNKDDEYEFCWYTYLKSNLSYPPQLDTLGKDLNLNCFITQPSGVYNLILEAKNKKTGICIFNKMDLTIASELSRGWYVTKDESNRTDIDWIKVDGNILSNVILSVNGENLPGKALKTTYMGSGYSYDLVDSEGDISWVKEPVIFVMSEEDMRIYNSETMSLIRRFDEFFVSVPEICKPQDAIHGYFLGSFVINDGKIHSLSTITSPSYGKFGYTKLGDYHLAKHAIRYPMGEVILFDSKNSSFLYATVSNTNINYFIDTEESKYQTKNINCDLLFMKERRINTYSTNPAFGLLKSREKEEYYSFIMKSSATTAENGPFQSFTTLQLEKEVYKGTVFGCHNISSVIYFATGDNVLKQHNITNQEENNKVFVFPENQKISFIDHVIYNEYNDPEYKVNNLVILTNDGQNWHLYCFDFVGETADIDSKNYKYYTGKGNANAVIYRGISSYFIN